MKKQPLSKIELMILERVNLPLQDLFFLRVDIGVKYIMDRLPELLDVLPEDQERLKTSTEFWMWWKRVWLQEDLNILRDYNNGNINDWVGEYGHIDLDYYKHRHDPALIDLYPKATLRTVRSQMLMDTGLISKRRKKEVAHV